MNKAFLLLIFALLIISSLAFASAKSGAIWTTKNDCGAQTQDANQYAIGEKVFINGEDFNAGNYNWDIKGQPGSASCDSNEIVASGSKTINSSESFCFEAYTVQTNDCGEYKANFGNI